MLKSKAAVMVQNLCEMLPMPFIIPGGAAKFANSLIEDAWSLDCSIFDGSKGPHAKPISLAAISLARGMEAHRGSVVVHTTCKGALGVLIRDMAVNRLQYSLNGTDLALLNMAADKYQQDDWKGQSREFDTRSNDGVRSQTSRTVHQPIKAVDPEFKQRRDDLQARLNAFPD